MTDLVGRAILIALLCVLTLVLAWLLKRHGVYVPKLPNAL